MTEHPRLWLTPLHRAELMHAFAQHVFQQKISAREFQQVCRDFEHDQNKGVWVTVSAPEKVFEICAELARHHGAHLGIRTLDSLHVASALLLNTDHFWTFDARQAKLASAERLDVF